MNRRSPRRARRRAPVAHRAGGGTELDGAILTATGLLVVTGLLMVYSATATRDLDRLVPVHFVRQLAACIVGVGVAAGAALLPLRTWQRAAPFLWAGGVALLVLTAFFGVEANGARRWLTVPGVGLTFQPVEPVCDHLVVVGRRTLDLASVLVESLSEPVAHRDLRVPDEGYS